MALKKLQDHFLVPKHEIVAKEKSLEILEELGTSAERLPRILLTDPMIQEIEAKKGDLIRIVRESPTAGTAIYYRIVV